MCTSMKTSVIETVNCHSKKLIIGFTRMPFRTVPRFMIFFTGYVLFLCIGASIFLAIEEDMETIRIGKLQKLRSDFLKENPCVHYDDLQRVIHAFEHASKKGILASQNHTSWNFGQSLLLTTSIVTTVGYGHITPQTKSGKIFTILFALIGIPLTLSVLSALVDRLLVPTTALLYWFNSKLSTSYHTFTIRLLHLVVVLNIAAVFLVVIPATLYHLVEPEWDFLDSAYYCFLSLTTIGFGDFTPGESSFFLKQPKSYISLYKICTVIYLFAGITYMMLALAVFYDIPQLNLGLLYTIEGDQFSARVHELEEHQE